MICDRNLLKENQKTHMQQYAAIFAPIYNNHVTINCLRKSENPYVAIYNHKLGISKCSFRVGNLPCDMPGDNDASHNESKYFRHLFGMLVTLPIVQPSGQSEKDRTNCRPNHEFSDKSCIPAMFPQPLGHIQEATEACTDTNP